MVETAIQFLLNQIGNFFTFIDSFVLFGTVSYLDLIVALFIVWLLVSNFVPRG